MSKKKKPVDYIDKENFSKSVEAYTKKAKAAIAKGKLPPIVPHDIAFDLMAICENLSYHRSFINYTYREDMVMDAVENCLKATQSFNPDAETRSGKPNAFSYFTTVAWYAMVRRIQKENKEVTIKTAIMNKSLPLDFMEGDDEIARYYVESVISDYMKD